MKLRISEQMDGFFDNDIEMKDAGVVSADRVRELTMAKLGLADPGPVRRPMRKLGRILLIAATVVMALSAAAVAVYQYGMKDTVIEDMPDRDIPGKTEAAMSLNGFVDSPEYQAYVEWESWNRAWQQENRNWFKEQGQDDSYYETAVNYTAYYQAYAAEQGEKLEEVLAKYGLTAHTDRESFYAEGTLCDILGTEDLFDGQYDVRDGYVYEDGAFDVDMVLTGDPSVWVTVVNAVHGSFSTVSGRMPSEYEEWSYVTEDGTETILVSGDKQSLIVAGLEGNYVCALISEAYSQEELQSLAEGINFAALKERFLEPVPADMLEAWRQSQIGATTTANSDDTVEQVISLLGDWWIGNMPEEASLESMTSTVPGAYEDYYRVGRRYDVAGAGVTLSYRELDLADEVGEEARLSLDTYTASDYQAAEDFGYKLQECTVNDHEALLINYEGGSIGLKWVDTEHELLFELSASWGGYFDDVHYWTEEEVLTMAGNVTGTPADEPLRRNAPTRAEKLAMNIMPLEEVHVRDYAEQEIEVLLTRAKLGALSLPDEYALVTDHTWGGADEYWGTGECLYQYQTGDNFRKGNYVIRLNWELYEDEEGVNRSRDVFEDHRDTMLSNWDFCYSCTINGFEGYAEDSDTGREITWLDTERGMILSLNTFDGVMSSGEWYTIEELMELAALVTTGEKVYSFYEEPNYINNWNELLDSLGAWAVTELPKGISEPRVIYGDRYETEPEWYLENDPCYMEVLSTAYNGGLELYYTRYWSDESRSRGINAAAFSDMETYYSLCDADAVTTALSVNGDPAMLVRYPERQFHGSRTELVWLDTERDLIFTLAAYDDYLREPLSQYDLIALAESVTEA